MSDNRAQAKDVKCKMAVSLSHSHHFGFSYSVRGTVSTKIVNRKYFIGKNERGVYPKAFNEVKLRDCNCHGNNSLHSIQSNRHLQIALVQRGTK